MLSDFQYDPVEAAKPLRPYQVEAVAALSAALANDTTRPQLLQLATGGGKTRVANDIVARWIREHGGPVLWITKDWRLLYQAARDASRRHPGHILYRIGGRRTALGALSEVPRWWTPTRSTILYSTFQTVLRRLDDGVLDGVALLVWDESHWGENAKAGKILTQCARQRRPVLGLTATARWDTRYHVVYSRSFFDLVREGYLAQPETWRVRTGLRWSPRLSPGDSDFSNVSLRVLAESAERNDAIIRTYAENADEFRRTIVFACNIEHANELAERFSRDGFAAHAIHTENDDAKNNAALEGFRRGRIHILVNVEMLTHGVDVPDANTIFLCRPTRSDILFAQMVGRGARRAEGKTHFNIVEFTDNLSKYGEILRTTSFFFDGAGSTSAVPRLRSRSAPRVSQHAFDPRGAPRWIPDDDSLPESCRGLWYREGQTFGLELELTESSAAIPRPHTERWSAVATALLEALRRAIGSELVAAAATPWYAGGGSGGKDFSVWNVEWDSSAGWEVTSRILSGEDGFIEVDAACAALEEAAAIHGVRVNYRTGTHLHLGWRRDDIGALRNAIRLVGLFEPALGTLVAPSRLARFAGGVYDISTPNQYCQPVSKAVSEHTLQTCHSVTELLHGLSDYGLRFATFNIKPLGTHGTVEVRLHSGTIEARKALVWVSLWQQLLWAAENKTGMPELEYRQVIVPDADIIELAREWLPAAIQPLQAAFLARVARRRAEVVDMWRARPELEPWTGFADCWLELAVDAHGAEPGTLAPPFLDAVFDLQVRSANHGTWHDVAEMLAMLVVDGLLVEPAFLEAPPNGRAVVTARTSEGIVPVLHVWDHPVGMKFWVYATPPGEDLGRGRAVYTEVRAADPSWWSQLLRLLSTTLTEGPA
ncbi:MAG: hypothetical protein EP329_09855 [Deltaproteobacteria bacterium]|nr:MAG: hypothetical protein EP329_09855 [Deltaproteobacteria bacterium]